MEYKPENQYCKSDDNKIYNNNISPINVEISSVKNLNNKKYIKRENFYIKLFITIIYFALIILIEREYRNYLFDKSLKFQEDIRKDHDKDSAFYRFWKFMSYFGENKITITVFFIIFIFFPISSSFLVLQTAVYAAFLTNFFKIIYRNGRPYWNSEILDIVCNPGYGNPSGHTMASTAYYLTITHILTNFQFFKNSIKGKILRVIIFILLIILTALIILSRVLLGAHGINQVLFGFTLGVGIYFIEIYILSYHTYQPNKFINHITNIKVIIIYMVIHIILLILLIIFYFILKNDQKIEYNIREHIFNGERCKIKPKYFWLKNDGFFQGLCITAILGAHIGIILLIFLLRKFNYVIDGNITEFNKSSIKRWLIRLPILIISAIFILIFFLISGDSSLAIVFIFKSALSFFFTGLGVYFIGIFLSIHCNLANENIKRIT